MLVSHPSLRALAFIAALASNAFAVTNSSTATPIVANNGTTVARLSAANPGNATVQAQPAPTDTPGFDYNFNLIFTGGQCSDSQKAIIRGTIKNIGGLARRGRLWENDVFHDWQPEVDYWFGSQSAENFKWITSKETHSLTCPTLRLF